MSYLPRLKIKNGELYNVYSNIPSEITVAFTELQQQLDTVTAERDELKAQLSAKGPLIARIERKRAVAQELEKVKAALDELKAIALHQRMKLGLLKGLLKEALPYIGVNAELLTLEIELELEGESEATQ